MTCIVGIEHAGRVWLGGDSLLSEDEGACLLVAEPKVFRRADGRVVIGAAGSCRFAALLQHVIPLDRLPESSDDVDRWVHVDLAGELADAIRGDDGVYNHRDDGDDAKGIALVGVFGKLYALHGDLTAYRPAAGHYAVGAGVDAALTSLAGSGRIAPGPRLRRALEAAEAANNTVRRPFNYAHT